MKRLVTLFAALAVLSGSPMMAHAKHYDDDRHDDRHDDRGPPPKEEHHGHYLAPRYEPPRGYEHRAWARGQVLPRDYYAERYVIVDYGHYGLRPPPRGYHWVRVDNDVVLVAITSGVIADVMLELLYHN